MIDFINTQCLGTTTHPVEQEMIDTSESLQRIKYLDRLNSLVHFGRELNNNNSLFNLRAQRNSSLLIKALKPNQLPIEQSEVPSFIDATGWGTFTFSWINSKGAELLLELDDENVKASFEDNNTFIENEYVDADISKELPKVVHSFLNWEKPF